MNSLRSYAIGTFIYVDFETDTNIHVLLLQCLHYLAASDHDRRYGALPLTAHADICNIIRDMHTNALSCVHFPETQNKGLTDLLADFGNLHTFWPDGDVFCGRLVDMFTQILSCLYQKVDLTLQHIRFALPRHITVRLRQKHSQPQEAVDVGAEDTILRMYTFMADQLLACLLGCVQGYITSSAHRVGFTADLTSYTSACVILTCTNHNKERVSEVSRVLHYMSHDVLPDLVRPPKNHLGAIAPLCLSVFKSVIKNTTYVWTVTDLPE